MSFIDFFIPNSGENAHASTIPNKKEIHDKNLEKISEKNLDTFKKVFEEADEYILMFDEINAQGLVSVPEDPIYESDKEILNKHPDEKIYIEILTHQKMHLEYLIKRLELPEDHPIKKIIEKIDTLLIDKPVETVN